MAARGLILKPRLKLYLSADDLEGVFGEGKWRLLDAIRRQGTLVSAARTLGRSYRKAWGDIRRAEQGLGKKLVEPSRGGSQKGKTELTPFAVSLMEAWDLYRTETRKAMNRAFDLHLAHLIDPAPGVIAEKKEFDNMKRTIMTDARAGAEDMITEPELASVKAGVRNGSLVDAAAVDGLARRLGLDRGVARSAIWLAGARPEPAAAIILIGGRSARMGSDKAFILVNGMSAASRLYTKLAPHFDEVFFAAAASQSSPVAGARCVHDTVAGRGPLAGLAAGLSASPCRVNFVIACDIPELDLPLMRKLLSCLERYEIAVPAFSPRKTEPLFGAYDRAVGATAKRLLDGGSLQVISVYAHHRTRVVAASGAGWYANLNTPADWRRYLKSWKKRKPTNEITELGHPPAGLEPAE